MLINIRKKKIKHLIELKTITRKKETGRERNRENETIVNMFLHPDKQYCMITGNNHQMDGWLYV